MDGDWFLIYMKIHPIVLCLLFGSTTILALNSHFRLFGFIEWMYVWVYWRNTSYLKMILWWFSLTNLSHQMSKYMKWNTGKYSGKVVASRRVLAMYGYYVFSVLSYTQAGLLAKIAINKVFTVLKILTNFQRFMFYFSNVGWC